MKIQLKYVRLQVLALALCGLVASTAGLADEELSRGSATGMGKELSPRDPTREIPFPNDKALVTNVGQSQDPMGPPPDRILSANARVPLNQTGCTICMTGSASVQWTGATGSFQVETISNNRGSGTSGPLDLSVRLFSSLPVFGQTVYPIRFSASVSAPEPLPAGFYYSNIYSGTVAFYPSSIPPGEYFLLFYLVENVSGTNYYDDWIVMDKKVSCNGSSCSIVTSPTAAFTFSANPKAGQAVQFTDTSTGSPTSWSWSFGDGGSSTAENPLHTFGAAGSYQVSLTASNSGGSNTATQTVVVSAAGGGGGGTTCTEDAYTACLIGGRYKVTSRWKNQYAGGATANLFKSKLTDTTNAFWIADANTYEFVIRINTATDNGRAWVTILTFTSVEYWVNVVDTKGSQQSFEYHSSPGNTTLIYDPSYFVYP